MSICYLPLSNYDNLRFSENKSPACVLPTFSYQIGKFKKFIVGVHPSDVHFGPAFACRYIDRMPQKNMTESTNRLPSYLVGKLIPTGNKPFKQLLFQCSNQIWSKSRRNLSLIQNQAGALVHTHLQSYSVRSKQRFNDNTVLTI